MAESRVGARAAAARFLAQSDQARLHDARRLAAARLPAAERALFVELVAGVTRLRILYDAIITAYADTRLERIEARLLTTLRLGLHQILHLDRMPQHAAVDSALNLLSSRRARGFANAILRNILREGRFTGAERAGASARRLLELGDERAFVFGRDVFPDPVTEPVAHLAMREAFRPEAAELLISELGFERAAALMRAANERPRLHLRRDPERSADAAAFIARLAEDGLEVVEEDPGEGLIFRLLGGDPAAGRAFEDGLYRVQGEFAASVVPLLAPKDTEHILDLCAPPGGKLLQIAELAPAARLQAYAHDARGRERLEEAKRDRGLDQLRILSGVDPFGAADWDAILLDVPCSNTGVLNRRPEARERLTRKEARSLQALQSQLLARSLDALTRTGARAVYATCSVLPSENGELVRAALAKRPGFVLEREITAFPGPTSGDGGFAALIRRVGEPS